MVKKFFSRGRALLSLQHQNILSAATVITAASFISSLFGLIKTRLLLRHFSATIALKQNLDAYWVALRLPELVFQLLVVGALSAAFIPVFIKYLNSDRHLSYRIASSVMNFILLIFFILSLLIFLFARPFIQAITSVQFLPHQLDLAANLSRIMIFAQILFAVSSFLTSLIQAQQRFLIPALAPVAYNLGIIFSLIYLTPVFGIYAPAIGVVFGALLHLLLQLPLALKLGFNYHLAFDFRLPGVKQIFRLMPPRVLALSVTQLELAVTVFFATALAAGSLTVLQIAQQLIAAPIRIFSVPIGQASLPFLSQDTAAGDLDKFKRTFQTSFNQILYLIFPASAILIVLRLPLVRLVYGSRQFPWAMTLLTGKTVAILSLSLFAQGLIHLLARAYYALHNTKTPFFIALVSVFLNVLLSYFVVFHWRLGVLGLAASTALASIFQAILLFIFLLPRLPGLFTSTFLVPPFKMALASFVTGIFLWLPMRLLDVYVFDTTRALPLLFLTIIAGLIGLLVYFALSALLKIAELSAFLSLLKRLGNWRQVLRSTEEVIEPAP